MSGRYLISYEYRQITEVDGVRQYGDDKRTIETIMCHPATFYKNSIKSLMEEFSGEKEVKSGKEITAIFAYFEIPG